jgi:hypothetical protein
MWISTKMKMSKESLEIPIQDHFGVEKLEPQRRKYLRHAQISRFERVSSIHTLDCPLALHRED